MDAEAHRQPLAAASCSSMKIMGSHIPCQRTTALRTTASWAGAAMMPTATRPSPRHAPTALSRGAMAGAHAWGPRVSPPLRAAVRLHGCSSEGPQTRRNARGTIAADMSHLQVGVCGPDQQPALLWLLLHQLRLLHPALRGQPVRLQAGLLTLRNVWLQVPGC